MTPSTGGLDLLAAHLPIIPAVLRYWNSSISDVICFRVRSRFGLISV